MKQIDEEINEENVEKYIKLAIAKYSEKRMLADVLFWNSAIYLLGKKYGFSEKFDEASKSETRTDEHPKEEINRKRTD